MLLCLAGCASDRTAGIEGTAGMGAGPDGASAVSKYVIVNNSKLARGIQVVDLRSLRTASNLLRASVTVVSKYSKTLEFQYKFAWFDAQGMEIDPEARPWTPVTLYGNETKTLQATAPNSAATEYKIKIRPR
jgi:uncharacterized protein YcfL